MVSLAQPRDVQRMVAHHQQERMVVALPVPRVGSRVSASAWLRRQEAAAQELQAPQAWRPQARSRAHQPERQVSEPQAP
jgi:hypothetical protein